MKFKQIKKIMVRLTEKEFYELTGEIKKEKAMKELRNKFKNKYKDKYSLQSIEDLNTLIYNYFNEKINEKKIIKVKDYSSGKDIISKEVIEEEIQKLIDEDNEDRCEKNVSTKNL